MQISCASCSRSGIASTPSGVIRFVLPVLRASALSYQRQPHPGRLSTMSAYIRAFNDVGLSEGVQQDRPISGLSTTSVYPRAFKYVGPFGMASKYVGPFRMASKWVGPFGMAFDLPRMGLASVARGGSPETIEQYLRPPRMGSARNYFSLPA